MKQRIGYMSTTEATMISGLSRYNLMRAFKLLNLGEAVRDTKTGRYTYYIGKVQLAKFIGMPIDELEARLSLYREDKKRRMPQRVVKYKG